MTFALADNPLGTAAWIIEETKVGSDSANNIESVFSKDGLLSNIMMYLVTDSAPAAGWMYRGNRDDTRGAQARSKTNVPTGHAALPREMRTWPPAQRA